MTKSVLIVKCSPPNDLEMEEFSAGLTAKKKGNNHHVQVVSYEQLQAGLKKNTNLCFDEICFVGHGSFHDIHSVPVRARKIAERFIGSYPLSQVGETAVLAFQKMKTHTFKFFTCESAVSKLTYGRKDDTESLVESFDEGDAKEIHKLLVSDEHDKISNIDYLAHLILRKMQKTYDTRTVRIIGMNGVGYIRPGSIDMSCFDVEHLKVFNEMRHKLAKIPNTDKNRTQIAKLNIEEEKLFDKFIRNRPSAYKIELNVSL